MPRGATTEGLACIADPARRALLARYLDGAVSAEMTLMYWLKAVPDIDALRRQLEEAIKVYPRGGIDSDQPARSVAEGIASCRTLFDWSVGQSNRALRCISLANTQILDAATTEIVELLRHASANDSHTVHSARGSRSIHSPRRPTLGRAFGAPSLGPFRPSNCVPSRAWLGSGSALE